MPALRLPEIEVCRTSLDLGRMSGGVRVAGSTGKLLMTDEIIGEECVCESTGTHTGQEEELVSPYAIAFHFD